jgi:hypothetical protein
MGEFVSACTRLGKMPVMYQGFAVPGGRERANRLGRLRFHPEKPVAVAPGQLGREFIRELRVDLEKVHDQEMADVAAAARQAVAARRNGKGVYAFVHGHGILHQMIGFPTDPGYFTQLNTGWFSQRPDIRLSEGDFVLCIGFDMRFNGWKFGKWDEEARSAGATLAWSFADYKKEHVEAVGDEIFISQHWDFGDAVVEVPGYDVRILPTSGVVSEAVLWMVNAEMLGLLQGEANAST